MERTVTLDEARKNRRALDDFMKENDSLVYKCLRMLRVNWDELEYEDMLQVGRMALYKSIKQFSYEGGATFSTYAFNMIYKSIILYKRDRGNHNGIRMPRWYRKLLGLSSQGKTETEILEELGITKAKIEKAFIVGNSIPLEISLTPGEKASNTDRKLADNLESKTNVEDDVADNMLLKQICDGLTPDEQLIFNLRTNYDMSQQEIANYTGGRIYQKKVSRMMLGIKEVVRRELDYVKGTC